MEVTIQTIDGPFILEGIATRTPGLVVTPKVRGVNEAESTGSKTAIMTK